MSVKSGQSVTVDFTTADPATGAAADASSLPTATLVVNGTDNAATVTVTNKTTGVYKAAVTLPTLSAGDVVSIRVAATVATVAGVGVVWTDVADTKRVSDLRDEAMRGTDGALTDKTGFSLTAAYEAAKTAAQAGEAVTLAADQPLYAPTTWRDLEAIGTPLQADDYTAPDNAGIAAAKAAAESADGKLTSERLALIDGVAQEATAQAIKTRTDTLYAATGTHPLILRLLLDSDGDGHPDDPPVGMGGVTCHLLAHGTHTRIRESQTTDSQGYVYWHGLAAGTYDVDPDAAGYEGVTVAVTVPE